MTPSPLRPALAVAAAVVASLVVWGAAAQADTGTDETVGPGPLCCAG